MSTATLNDFSATRARVDLPAWGCWYADVELASEETITGAATLVIADLTMLGTVVSGGASHGRSRYRIVAGAGGWGQELTSRGYVNDAGVKRSTVLADAAQTAGETFADDTLPAATSRVGGAYVRPVGPASRVLQLLAAEQWYVGVDGLTYLGRRAAAELDVEATRTATDLARGTIELAAEQISTIVPGVIVDGLEAVDVCHEVSAGKGLRSTIWGEGVADGSRRLAALKLLVQQAIPELKYSAPWEYRVVSQTGERLNLQPVRVSTGMPDLRLVRVRPGVPGVRADHVLGTRVVVAFVDANPAQPVVVAFEDADSEGFVPDAIDMADALGEVVRNGETVAITGVQAGAGVAAVVLTVNPATFGGAGASKVSA